MELSLTSSATVALRNEEVNRQRLASRAAGTGGAGQALKVTDPAAFARLLADMAAKAEEARAAEEARESERRAREGAAYCTPEQRVRAARDGKRAERVAEEAMLLERRLDPRKDYYALLGVEPSASAAEIKTAYKQLSRLHHPDKAATDAAAGDEQRAAVARRFKDMAEAYDVLADEELRAVFDKVHDHRARHAGQGLPPLSPEEAALLRQSGLAELSRLRRAGPKIGKHAPLECQALLSLEKLNTGTTKTLAVARRRLDYTGAQVDVTQNVHLVVRRGSRDGDRLVFEGEGEETVDTEPGDLVVTLRAKPHKTLRRVGDKDLEVFAAAAPPGGAWFVAEAATIHGRPVVLCGSAIAESLAAGGTGGVWRRRVPGAGLWDAAQPYAAPPGDLFVSVRFPPLLLRERRVTSCLRPRPVTLLGSADAVSGGLAAGALAAALRHQLELEAAACSRVRVVCLSGGTAAGPSPAAAALLRGLRRLAPVDAVEAVTRCGVDGCCVLLEDGWAALEAADVIVLDAAPNDLGGEGGDAVMAAVWARFWLGAHVVAAGGACSLVGAAHPARPARPPILPWYHVRASGGGEGWAALRAAVAAAPRGFVGVGVLATSIVAVDPATGAADLVCAPSKDVLVAASAWGAAHELGDAGLEEAADDYGFMFEACCKC